MKRFLSFFFALIFALTLFIPAFAGKEVSLPPQTEAVKDPIYDITLDSQGVYVCNGETGTVIYKKAENARMFPASTTKIMTALVVLGECADPKNTFITVPDTGMFSYIIEAGGVNAALTEGETLSVYDLLMGLMLNSYCDVADLLAYRFGGESVAGFVEKMNQKAKALGLSNTHFENAHGLHHSNHYSSPKDIAAFFAEAVKNPVFREIISTREYTIPATEKKGERALRYTVGMFYPSHKYYQDSFIGGKSGFTNQAGRCLVTLSEKEGQSYISVLLGANMDTTRRYSDNMSWVETNTLISYAYDHYEVRTLLKKGQEVGKVAVKDSDVSLSAVAQEDVRLLARKDTEPRWELSLPKEVEVSQVEKSLEVGNITLFFGGEKQEETHTVSLVWDGTPITTKSFIEKGAESAAEAVTGIFKTDKTFVVLLILLLLVVAVCIPAMKITQLLHKKKSHIPKH